MFEFITISLATFLISAVMFLSCFKTYPKIAFTLLLLSSGLYYIFLTKTFPDMLGYPVVTQQSKLPEQFRVLHYVEKIESKEFIIWIRTPDSEYPRSYVFEATNEFKKQVKKSKKRGRNGTQMRFVKGKNKANKEISNIFSLEVIKKPMNVPVIKEN